MITGSVLTVLDSTTMSMRFKPQDLPNPYLLTAPENLEYMQKMEDAANQGKTKGRPAPVRLCCPTLCAAFTKLTRMYSRNVDVGLRMWRPLLQVPRSQPRRRPKPLPGSRIPFRPATPARDPFVQSLLQRRPSKQLHPQRSLLPNHLP